MCRSRAVLALALALLVSGRALAFAGGYAAPAQLDLSDLLTPPPAATSMAGRQDLQAVLDLQGSRTPADIARARADTELSAFRFADVVGPEFTPARLPKTAAFLQRVTDDAKALYGLPKRHWQRPRPYALSAAVQPVLPRVSSASYPSGHSTVAYLWAIVLTKMLPEKQAELFARAREYGRNRIVGGVHYPTDDEAGRICGAAIAAVMMQSPAFRADLETARQELRAALPH